MRLYMAVTQDKYEFPIAIADTQQKLAMMLGIDKNTIASSLSKVRRGEIKNSRFKEVFIDEDN